jgi:Domain of unknown function (DUF4258)
MYQRSITAEEVRTVIQTGETIEDYPNDFPYPSRLLFGMVRFTTDTRRCRGQCTGEGKHRRNGL